MLKLLRDSEGDNSIILNPTSKGDNSIILNPTSKVAKPSSLSNPIKLCIIERKSDQKKCELNTK